MRGTAPPSPPTVPDGRPAAEPLAERLPTPARAPQRWRRRLIAGLLALAVFVVVGLLRGWFAPPATGPLTALGTLEATEVTISAEVNARIRQVLAVEGQAVQAGDVLVRLDDAVPQLQYRLGTPAEQQVLQLQLEKYTLTAPVAGVVLRRSAEPGEVATVGAPLLTLADLSQLEATAYLPQRDLGRVYVGQPVTLEAEALPGARFLGTVRSVAERAEFTPRNTQTPRDRLNLVFAVKVRVSNPDRRLKPGMSVVVRFAE